MPKNKNKSVVVIGGGTGVYAVLTGLKNKNVDLSAIVSMCDDGGSTGKLRDSYGVLPPGDIRRCLVALSSADKELRKLFEYRFDNGNLKDHSFGNLFLTACEKMSKGDFRQAVGMASKVLGVKGKVIPVTLSKVILCGELEDGTIVRGETNIDVPKHNPEKKIIRLFTEPSASANSEALTALKTSDTIIIGPGDLKTSILPNFLIKGIPEAVNASPAKKVYICNLMTKYGETNDYTLKDFVDELGKYTNLDYIIVNNKKPDSKRLKKYSRERSIPVIVPANFSPKGLLKKGVMTTRGLIRHDYEKLAKVLMKIITA